MRQQLRFGKLAGDEIILAAIDELTLEVHCHGGRQAVTLILRELENNGCEIAKKNHETAWALLAQARTLRTASILLDQARGAFESAIQELIRDFNQDRLARLASLAPIGRHLVEPWKIAIAGAPNVGKSSLVNALAGYERAVVSPIAGTTRDAVATILAFDGWPVELTDTAGLRETQEDLEAAGIERTREVLARADVIVWVIDATTPIGPTDCHPHLIVANKCDLANAAIPANAIAVSATLAIGLPGLIAAIVRLMVPVPPEPGEAIPYSQIQAEKIGEACTLASTGRISAARQILASCLVGPE